MDKKDETMDQFSGRTLPGTGGDYIDESDVEGHRAPTQKAVDDGAGPEGQKRLSKYSDDESDVEGHRAPTQKAVDDGAGPEGLYRGGPTTQGEVIKRGPGENPHGDR
jgi:hypothetical protein